MCLGGLLGSFGGSPEDPPGERPVCVCGGGEQCVPWGSLGNSPGGSLGYAPGISPGHLPGDLSWDLGDPQGVPQEIHEKVVGS